MKYQNNSTEGIVIPVRRISGDELASTSWIKFHPGEIKEVPEHAILAANAHGLTKVDSTVEESPVEAEVSVIADTPIETKKIKKSKKKVD
jgi:hypothetical protein